MLVNYSGGIVDYKAYRVSGSGGKAADFADVAAAREFRVILP